MVNDNPGAFDMSLKRIYPLLAAGLIALHGLGAMPAVAATAKEMLLLEKGQVVVHEETPPGQELRQLKAQILIDRPVNQVWPVIRDQNNLFQNDPFMKKARVVKRMPGEQELVEYTLKISPLLPQFVYTTHINFFGPSKANFKRVSGSFKDFQGYATLEPAASGKKTLMTYSLGVDLGFMVPPFVVNQVLKTNLPRLLSGIRQTVYRRVPNKV
jgi:uncharacterized membrane protein